MGEEAYKQHVAMRGHLGGIAKVPKGFAMKTPEQRSEAGTKGGSTPRRPKVTKDERKRTALVERIRQRFGIFQDKGDA